MTHKNRKKNRKNLPSQLQMSYDWSKFLCICLQENKYILIHNIQLLFFFVDKVILTKVRGIPCNLAICIPLPPIIYDGVVQRSYPCLSCQESYFHVMVATVINTTEKLFTLWYLNSFICITLFLLSIEKGYWPVYQWTITFSTKVYMIPIAFWNIHIVRYIQGTPTPFSYTSLQHATKMQFYSQLTSMQRSTSVLFENLFFFSISNFILLCFEIVEIIDYLYSTVMQTSNWKNQKKIFWILKKKVSNSICIIPNYLQTHIQKTKMLQNFFLSLLLFFLKGNDAYVKGSWYMRLG